MSKFICVYEDNSYLGDDIREAFELTKEVHELAEIEDCTFYSVGTKLRVEIEYKTVEIPVINKVVKNATRK